MSSLAFTMGGGPVGVLRLWRRTTWVLTALIRSLMVVAIHFLWFMFGSSIFTGTAPSNPDEELEIFVGITSAEDCLALKTRPAVGPRNGGNSNSLNMLVASGESGHYFQDAFIPALQYKFTTKCWMHRAKSSPPGGNNWMELCGDCSVATLSMATERSV